jgi:Polyketide cyclase / dehydrase and lipid transport
MLSSLSSFTYEHSVEARASAAAVWSLYSDVGAWPAWDHAAEHVTLDGPFAAGSAGTLKLHGQEPLPFRLTEVQAGCGFADETEIPGGVVRFRHTIAPAGEGRLRLTHAVEVDAPAPVAEQIGGLISEGVPVAMAKLARLAEEATP